MGAILRSLLWSAALTRGAGEMKLALRRARRRATLVILGLLLTLVGAAFLLAAGFMELVVLLGAIRASLIVGAVLVVAGGGFFLAARKRTVAVPAADRKEDPSPLSATLVGVGRELGAAASRHPGAFVIAAFVGGLLLSGRGRRH